jgi:hypothetical protein
MAAIPADALVLWNPLPVVRLDESSRPRGGMWAVIRNAILSPSPGRTLDQFYTALDTVLEKQANHAAHALGLGPHIVAEKIKALVPAVPGISYIQQIIPLTSFFLGSTWFFLQLLGITVYYCPRT